MEPAAAVERSPPASSAVRRGDWFALDSAVRGAGVPARLAAEVIALVPIASVRAIEKYGAQEHPGGEGGMQNFTIEGVALTGSARITESQGGLRDLAVSVRGLPFDTLFAWTGRKLRFEGEAVTPAGEVKQVVWDVLASSGAGGEAKFVGAGDPQEGQ